MRRILFAVLAFAAVVGIITTGSRAEKKNTLEGDYVEVRTASVFAGACHYNGELTTTGRDAIMAWKVASGSWAGVDLSGVRALAVVTADANLSEPGTPRHTELVVDSSASPAQAVAMANALKTRYASALGKVVALERAPLTFTHEKRDYSVAAPGLATINVEGMPDDLCCKMPQLVWYSPLVDLAQRKVGFTKQATYFGGPAGEPWERAGENGAFYGTFSF